MCVGNHTPYTTHLSAADVGGVRVTWTGRRRASGAGRPQAAVAAEGGARRSVGADLSPDPRLSPCQPFDRQRPSAAAAARCGTAAAAAAPAGASAAAAAGA